MAGFKERGPDGDDGIPTGRLRRTAPVAGLVARTTGEAVVKAMRRKVTGAEVQVDHERAAERYAQLLGRSKGALIKAGQALSFVSMSASVPPEARLAYQRALSRLRDDAPPMDAAVAREVLEAELGQPTEAAFDEFDWEPLAAASIGQVHRARLTDGRPVAVKIQYPGAAAAIEADLANHELLSTFIALVMSFSPRRLGVDTRAVAKEVNRTVRAELDYRQEAANQRQFADLYRGHPFIHVPEVVDELCTGRVLTQELVEGLHWEQALKAEEALRERWARAIMRYGPGSVGCFSIFNADPHPGNYLFHPDGRVSFLDYGCVVRVSSTTSEQLTRLLRDSLRGDAEATWATAVEAGVWDARAPVTPREALDYWREPLVMFWGRQPFRMTPELVGAGIERQFSPLGASANALRFIHAPEDFTLSARMQMGVFSLVADLDVSYDWAAMAAEFYEHQPPTDELAEQHWSFIVSRHPNARRHA